MTVRHGRGCLAGVGEDCTCRGTADPFEGLGTAAEARLAAAEVDAYRRAVLRYGIADDEVEACVRWLVAQNVPLSQVRVRLDREAATAAVDLLVAQGHDYHRREFERFEVDSAGVPLRDFS